MANTELLDHYVRRTKELEQATKWLRAWTINLSVSCAINNQPRQDRANYKIGCAMTRLFNLIND